VIATSILVAIEANTVGAGTKGRKRDGPLTWFFGCLLLWLVAFPGWMARRSKYGLKNLCFAAVLVALLFAGVVGYMSYAIEEAKSEVRKSLNDGIRQMEHFQPVPTAMDALIARHRKEKAAAEKAKRWEREGGPSYWERMEMIRERDTLRRLRRGRAQRKRHRDEAEQEAKLRAMERRAKWLRAQKEK